MQSLLAVMACYYASFAGPEGVLSSDQLKMPAVIRVALDVA